MAATTETLVGVFAHVDTTVRALEELWAKGYHDVTVYTPVPVHEIEEVLERDRPGLPADHLDLARVGARHRGQVPSTRPRGHRRSVVAAVFHHRVRADGPLRRDRDRDRHGGAGPPAPVPSEPGLRPALHERSLRHRRPLRARALHVGAGNPPRGGRRGRARMKYVFILTLLFVAASGGLMA